MRPNTINRAVLAFAVASAVLWPGAAGAQEPDLLDMGLQELLGIKVERVFGASRRLQPVTEAPSSVTIITSAEIERLGYQSLADILRSVRGLYVSYDRNYSFLGTRGFSLPGDYNTRILLLVDGHRMNDNIYDQAAIGPEFGLDVTAFDRVEIIRGPISSLYGTNAFFGVVNVITKTGASQPGLSVSTDVGSLGTQRASLSLGRRTRKGLDLFVNGSVSHTDGQSRLYVPEFDSPDTNNGIAEGLDDEQVAQAFGHVGLKAFTLKAAYSHRQKSVPTAAFDTVFNDPAFRTVDERGFVDLQWGREVRKTRVDVRTSVDRYWYDGRYPYATDKEGQPYFVQKDYALGTWFGVDARASRPLPWRQRLTFGGEYRDNLDQQQAATSSDPESLAFDIRQSSTTVGFYLLDEITLHNRLLLNVGGRYDHHPGFDRITPRAALIYTPAQGGTFKYLFGSAFRAPNTYETNYFTYFYPHSTSTPRDTLRAESITTHEIVWEKYTSDWFRSSVTAYTNSLDGLIRLDSTESGELFFANRDRALAKGLELEAEVKNRHGVHALASYALQQTTDRDTDTTLTNSPRHAIKARGTIPVWRHGSLVSGELQHLSSRRTLSGSQVGAATLFNLSLSQPLGRGVALTGRAHNVLDRRYADPASEEHRQDTIDQNGRTFVLSLRWRLGVR